MILSFALVRPKSARRGCRRKCALSHAATKLFCASVTVISFERLAPNALPWAMNQIYRPAFVLSHFVHYSTITANIVLYYKDSPDPSKFIRRVQTSDWGDAFLDELTPAVLVHTNSVLPHETMTRNATCQLGSKHVSAVGYTCPDSLPFDDKLHQKNVFRDENGSFCNCWVNPHVEGYLVPRLEAALKSAPDLKLIRCRDRI
jgi:hypothetical protein